MDADWDKKTSVMFVENYLRNCGMSVPLLSELMIGAKKQGLAEQELDEILRYLVRKQRAYFFEGDYIHSGIVDSCRKKLLQTLAEQPEGMTIAQFRDLVSGNRRICLALIGIYDSEGITKRKGDLRVLTEKGRSQVRIETNDE